MNQDIIYEILKFLYLCPEENGGALLARKVLISRICYGILESRNFEKPIVFKISGDNVDLILEKGITVYLEDYNTLHPYFAEDKIVESRFRNSSLVYCNRSKSGMIKIIYDYSALYIIKIFGYKEDFSMPHNVREVYSIGSLTKTKRMFINHKMDFITLKNWDTTYITDMSLMFWNCPEFNQNVGRNWNTSNVIDMSGMFGNCKILNKNVGKKWDTSNVVDMSNMFECCYRLNKLIGKNWNLKKIENMRCMFIYCECLFYDVSKILSIPHGIDKTAMFHECGFRIKK